MNGNELEYRNIFIKSIYNSYIIDLHDKKIGVKGCVALLKFLKTNPMITTVDLSNARIRDEGIILLVKSFDTLIKLNLSYNDISDTGVIELANALTNNKSINIIDLSNNNIGDKGVTEFGSALEKNKSLTTINLCNNEITNIGAKYLVNSLEKNTNITSMDLCGNYIKYTLKNN